MFSIKYAIRITELISSRYEYVGSVWETENEYALYMRDKDDDEWIDDDAWAVSKKTGRVRELGGEVGFLFGGVLAWKREKYKEKGHSVTGQERRKA